MDPPPRRSKQQASKNIASQRRKRPRDDDIASANSSTSSGLPVSLYGVSDIPEDADAPDVVVTRDLIRNALVNTVSDMYFGTTDPFPEILRCLDNRIDPHTHRYISGLTTLLKSEIQDNGSNKKANKEKVIVTPLDMLACPFRRPQVIDAWNPYDVTMFELGICEHRGFQPKKMHALFEGRKSVEELISFFETVYSKSDNYRRISRIINNDFESSAEEDSGWDDSNPNSSRISEIEGANQ
jgi:hypothetical protein